MKKIISFCLCCLFLTNSAWAQVVGSALGEYTQQTTVDDNQDIPLFVAGQARSNARIKYRDFKMQLPYGAWTTFGNDTYLVPSGNVGMGTALPLQKVDVVGNIQLTGSLISKGSSSVIFKPNLGTITNPTVGYLTFNGGLLPAGNIGIGTVPVEALHVMGKVKTSMGVVYPDGTLQTTASVSGVAAGSGTELQARNSIGSFQAVSSSAVDSNGNVGIGTITPIRRFEVGGSDGNTAGTGTGTAGIGIVNYNTTDGNGSEISFSTVDTAGARAAGSKIQGIAMSHSPAAITGDMVFYNRSAGTMAESARLTAAGNFGIGTNLPIAFLDLSKDYKTTESGTKLGIRGFVLPTVRYDGSAFTGQDETLDHAFEAIKFTTSATGSAQIDITRMKISSINTLVNPLSVLTFKIYTDSAGVPGAQVAGSTSTTLRFGTLTTSYTNIIGNCFVSSLTAGTYWFVISYTKAPTGSTISMDTAASGTSTHAYSDDGSSWTTESNKDGYLIIRRSANTFMDTSVYGGAILKGINLAGQALDITSNGASGIGALITANNGTGVDSTASTGSGVIGRTTYGTGVAGVGGVNGIGLSLTQSGSMTWNGYNPLLLAVKSVTLGTWGHYGDVLRVSSSVADTGDLVRVIKQDVPKLKIASTGDMVIGGNLTVADTSSLGSEKCSNTAFTGAATSWTLGSGWAYSSNNVIHTVGNTGTISQDCTEVAGETYLLSYDIGSWTVGFITASVGGVSAVPNATSATYKKIILATGTGDVTLTPSSDFDGTIDNVSLKKITGGQLTTIGNVGIGTPSPGRQLDVWGDVRLGNGGKIYMGGNVGISCSGSSVVCTRMEGGACTAGSCLP